MLGMNDIDIRSLDLNLLKALRFLLEEKNVSRAARRMHVSQSAMSHTLGRLRDAFADPLFVRVGRGLEATERARDLYPEVCAILDQISSLLKPVQFDPAVWQGNLVIHTHDFIVSGYLGQRLAAVHSAAQGLKIELAELRDDSYQLMEAGSVDLIIAAGLGVSPHHRQLNLFPDEIVGLCDTEHPLTEGAPSQAYFDYPHVQLKLLEYGADPISAYAMRNGLSRVVSIQTDTLNIQPGLLQKSRLVAFVPKSLAQQVCESGRLKWLPLPFHADPIKVRGFWHDRHHNDSAMRWLRDTLFR